eukprot:COSAG04_NODE_562_length_12576_cov_154.338703_4_plen_52_part_00
MGCRALSGMSSLTADIGALAGLSLTELCAPSRARLLHLLALKPRALLCTLR